MCAPSSGDSVNTTLDGLDTLRRPSRPQRPFRSKTEVKIGVRHYAGIFLLSLATLLLELSLTRVLSVALWYHFGFLIISTALLGFGASGVVLALWRGLREQISLDRALAVLAALFGVTTVACFWLMQRIPFDPFSLLANRWQLLFMSLYYLVISTPFFCSGLALALLFTRGSPQVNRLYAFDLVGAGLGCAAIAVVMPVFGGSGSVVVAAALGLLAAVVFGFRRTRGLATAAAVFCLLLFTSAFFAERILPISVTPNKQRPQFAPIYTAWNTFSRIDVYERPPNAQTKAPGARRFVFDAGTAATGINDLRPDVRDYLSRHTDDADYTSGIAYVGKQRPKILIIGSGGGQQVLDALHFGAREVTAVEINPIINEVVSSRMRNYWGNLFNQPEVRLITKEGRSYVRRSQEQYDAIISAHTISNAAIASGALSLAENYVLTREAFEDYLDHLAPDGVLYFTRPEAQLPRLFATAREIFAARGISNPSWHLYAYRYPPSQREGQGRLSFAAGFLLKKSQYTPEELRRIEALLKASGPESNAPETLYSPLEPRDGGIYQALVTAPDLQAVYAAQPSQIEPATDDRPFFNQHTRWSSLNLATVRDVLTQQKQGRLALEDRPFDSAAAHAVFARAGARPKPLALPALLRGAGLRFHHDRNRLDATLHPLSRTIRLHLRRRARQPARLHGRRRGAVGKIPRIGATGLAHNRAAHFVDAHRDSISHAGYFFRGTRLGSVLARVAFNYHARAAWRAARNAFPDGLAPRLRGGAVSRPLGVGGERIFHCHRDGRRADDRDGFRVQDRADMCRPVLPDVAGGHADKP